MENTDKKQTSFADVAQTVSNIYAKNLLNNVYMNLQQMCGLKGFGETVGRKYSTFINFYSTNSKRIMDLILIGIEIFFVCTLSS
jgi:hypothetical protein